METISAVVVALIGASGLLIGSFLNVVVYRVPRGLSVVRPGSSCPGCNAAISPRDNVPVLSWLVLRGRCRHCHEHISPRYPLTEALTGVVWATLAWWCLFGSGVPAMLPTLLVVSAACIALWQIDLEHHRLPNAIVYPLYPLVALGMIFAGLVSGQWPSVAMLGAIAVWLAVFGGLYLLTRGRGMGMGDVKLAPVLAAVLGWYGWGPAILGLLAAFIIGGLVGAALLMSGRRGRREAIPFGPFMIIGITVGALFGTTAGQWYLGLA